jgi:photosystem II stability/assembly factor-like uncharacterized protein
MATAKDGTVYLGTADGHVFATSDRGGHWELRGRTTKRGDSVVQALIVDARSAKTLYAGVWYLDAAAGGGLFRSEDGGQSWQAAGLSGEAVRSIEQSPQKPDEFVAGTRTGVFRTEDGGKNWERISPAGDPELRNVDSIAIDPRNDAVIYAGTYHLPWKTADGGKNWKAIPAGMIDDSDVMSIRTDAEKPDMVFASACSGIYRSANGGEQWVKLQGIPFSSRRTQEIVQNPANPQELFAATTEGLWVAGDRGENWTRMTPREWIINAVSVLPSAAGTRILLGTDSQGILSSDDDAHTFAHVNQGFVHPLLAAFAADPAAPGHLLVQANGARGPLMETKDAGKSWEELPGERLKGEVSALFGAQRGWWATFDEGGAARYEANTRRWEKVRFVAAVQRSRGATKGKAVSLETLRKLPFVRSVREQDGMTYLATSEGLWKLEGKSLTARRVSEKTVSGTVLDVSVGQQVCALRLAQLVCMTDRGTDEKVQQAPGQPGEGLWLERAAGEGEDPLLVGTRHGIYELRANDESWHAVQSGLPAVALHRAAFSGNRIGVASDSGGFYLSNDGGKSWTRTTVTDGLGIVLGVTPDGAGGFFVATRSEGVLHWRPE